jgi:hypothetical protein
MALPELRSPVARALLPVVGGVVVLSLIAGFLWLMAAYISSGEVDSSERLAPSTFPVGNVEFLSDLVAEEGPLLFPELGTPVGSRSIVVDHEGDDPASGWRVYWAHPADRDASCVVTQIVGTSDFTDCEGRTVPVTDLAPPDAGVRPVVYDATRLEIDLRGTLAASGTPATTDAG